MACKYGNGKWKARWSHKGKRYSKSGFTTKAYAEAYEAQQRVNIEKGLIGIETEKEVEISDIIKKYILHCERYKKASTAKRDRISFKAWKTFFRTHSIIYTAEIEKNHLYDFVTWRETSISHKGTPISKRTINIELQALSSCFFWAYERGLIKQNPIPQKLPLFKKKRTALPRYLTEKEIQIIETAAKKDKRATCIYEIIAILLRTGMRNGEICSLEIKNIDLDRKQIILKPEQTKGNRQRNIPIPDGLIDIFEKLIEKAQKEKRPHLVYSRAKKPQYVINISRRFRNLVDRLEGKIENTKEIHVHTLRRTYISHMIMAGVDPVKVMAIVGHQEWSTIKKYLVLSPQYVDSGKNCLPY